MKRFRHGDYVNGDVAKTVTTRQCIAFLAVWTCIKSN